MQGLRVVREVAVRETPRLLQVAGLFDLPLAARSRSEWTAHLDLDVRPWQIGLIVGPSGSGKNTIAEEVWPGRLVTGYDWPRDASVIDGFPAGLGIKAITDAMCSVGFSSPPAWVRPFRCLSTGEQFRANLARAIVAGEGLVVYDEFTSVVDRVVARTASAAVAKAVRRGTGQFVALTCHEDVLPWLQPDWVYRPDADQFDWRSLQRRPDVPLAIYRVDQEAWKLFKRHHYLSGHLHTAARCWAAFWEDAPVAFESAIHHPERRRTGLFREHRLVVLPDYQGVGIGAALSAHVGSWFRAVGQRWTSRTAHPGLIRHRYASPLWRVNSGYGMQDLARARDLASRITGTVTGFLTGRFAATFEYVGPPHPDKALAAMMLAYPHRRSFGWRRRKTE